MLRYLGMGYRQFGQHPMYVHRRANWEFFAVVHGQCGARLRAADRTSLHPRHLWVFPPETAHGWSGKGTQRCRIAVFHFGSVPDLLERAARRNGCLAQPLTVEQSRWIWRLAADLKPHYHRSTEKSRLLFHRALIDLALLALENVPPDRSESDTGHALQKVEASLAWYAEHMAEQPKLDTVAAAVSVSVRHLRRLFDEVRNESPQAAFARLRVQRAVELLSHSGRKLDAISAACGFSSSSDFCRVFKSHRKISPHAWRRKMLRGYKAPGSVIAS